MVLPRWAAAAILMVACAIRLSSASAARLALAQVPQRPSSAIHTDTVSLSESVASQALPLENQNNPHVETQIIADRLRNKAQAQAVLNKSVKSLSILANKPTRPADLQFANVANADDRTAAHSVAVEVADNDSVKKDCLRQPKQGAKHNDVYLPNLHIELELRSPRARQPSDITIVSQLSLDRLDMLGHQCSAWGGVTSVAVYLPLLTEESEEEHIANIAAARKQLEDFHDRTEAAGGCRLDLVLATEHMRKAMLFAYPYNALRNAALLRASTDVILLLDVDFAVSVGLHERLSTSAAALSTDTSQYRHAIVLPAFETDPGLTLEEGALVAASAVNGNKQHLEAMFRSRQVIQFAEFYPAGHKPTKYNTWFKATSPYPARFKMGYEPYILVSRAMVPLYDERFRGYGFDKVMHIWQMHVQGFHFVTHPSAFVVHHPHTPSAGYKAAFTGPAYTTKHRSTGHMNSMKKLSEDMIREVRSQTYPQEGVSTAAHCRPVPKQQPRLDAWW